MPQIHKNSYENLGSSVDAAQEALAGKGFSVNPASSLGTLFTEAKRIADQFKENPNTPFYPADVYTIVNAQRVVDSITSQIENPAAKTLIRAICSNDIELSNPEQSKAKDYLFELELFSQIYRAGSSVTLEEPDLVADFEFGKYAIACKKINSLNNLEKQLSKGKKQLLPLDIPGVIAINVDSQLLFPGLHKFGSYQDLRQVALEKLEKFCRDNEFELSKVSSSKADALFVVGSVVGVIKLGDRYEPGMAAQIFVPYVSSLDGARQRVHAFQEKMHSLK